MSQTFKLKVDDANVIVAPELISGRCGTITVWNYSFSNLDGSSQEKDWHPNLSTAKHLAAVAYRVKTGKIKYRAKWTKINTAVNNGLSSPRQCPEFKT